MAPPPRPAHLFQTHNGLSREAAQWGLLLLLTSTTDAAFTGDLEGQVYPSSEVSPGVFRSVVECTLGEAVLELSLQPDGWVKAEVTAHGRVVFRAWIEDPYEEKEGWPDEADGVGEGPLRISKKGWWVVIRAARFPGVPEGEHGLFRLELKG